MNNTKRLILYILQINEKKRIVKAASSFTVENKAYFHHGKRFYLVDEQINDLKFTTMRSEWV